MTELSIRLPSSRSTGRYCRDVFSGCPKKYSISSPCSTPIHSPHSDVLVRYKNQRERDRYRYEMSMSASERRDIVVNLARNYADKHPPFLFIYLISPRALPKIVNIVAACRVAPKKRKRKKKKEKPKSEKSEKSKTAKKSVRK